MIQRSLSRLSVLLITYNHAAFVERAVESVLMQILDDPFEIVVADDGSTDNTIVLLKQIASNNPHLTFRFLDSESNRGITRNYQRAFASCGREYVAVLEGDDYWTSPFKLRCQLEFLDSHLECDLCSVNYYVYEEHRCQFTPRTAAGSGYMIFGARELIADNLVGNFSTCMYRVAALERLPPALYAIRSYDWAVNICIGRFGLIGFLKDPMSVYRIHHRGAWSLLSHVEKLKTQLGMIPAYDELTNHVFGQDFAFLEERLNRAIAEAQSQPISSELQMPALELMNVPPLYNKVLDIVPPIFITMGRLIFPPAFKRYLSRVFFGG